MTAAPLPRVDVTGLILAGGRGERMGGVDKGLQLLGEQALVLHALRRLMPQVGAVAINANRNILEYEFFGAPVWPDSVGGQPGPLAGLLTGLQQCNTPWLLTVPCDTPGFPLDLASRLVGAAEAQAADVALAASPDGSGGWRPEPVFCLARQTLASDLAEHLTRGERGVERWARRHRHVIVPFEDAQAFFNANTLAELHQLEARQAEAGAPLKTSAPE
jgi:molybdopterin-guanine dinucleotide biosynthesis protein A